MTDNLKISIRYKMSTAYGFHMDFQFWVLLTMLGGFQMLQIPRITKLDRERPVMVQNQIFFFQGLDFEYTQPLPSPVLENLKFWTSGTPLLNRQQIESSKDEIGEKFDFFELLSAFFYVIPLPKNTLTVKSK